MHTIGDQLGPYRLVYKLGRGSFGTVWLAERKTSVAQTTVAVKIPIDEELDSKLFEQESQLWALASGHPNVLPIIEADVIDGQLLIVSEYAADGSLDDLLKGKEENFSTSESVEIISNILGGLQHLHSKGIIHRDLKPGNILFQGRIPRLGDFGISRLYSSTTHSHGVAGTPIYMAPEAFDGKRNEQTDIWSVGIIFYQLLNGHLPFPNDDLGILLKSIFFEPPASFSKAIPKSIESVVLRSLAKAPSERYHTASEMLSDLQSQAVKIDLILEPASQPKGQEESWDGGKSQEVRSKPRAHHYAVVHRVLRDNAFSFPATLVDNLIGPKGEDYMKIKWEMNVGSRMTGDEHTDEDVPAEGIECYSITVGTGLRVH